jgi:hypothetical protein
MCPPESIQNGRLVASNLKRRRTRAVQIKEIFYFIASAVFISKMFPIVHHHHSRVANERFHQPINGHSFS